MYTASTKGLAAISSKEVNLWGILYFRANSSALPSVLEHTAASSNLLSCAAPANTQSVMKLVPTTPKRTLSIQCCYSTCDKNSDLARLAIILQTKNCPHNEAILWST